MKILVRRTGGFAGLSEALYEVDTSALEGSVAAELERKMRALESAERSQTPAARPIGADFLKYEITLTDQHGHRTLVVADNGSTLSELAHEILNELSAITQR